MIRYRRRLVASVALLIVICVMAAPNAVAANVSRRSDERKTATVQGPVVDADVADPFVIAADGKYFAFSTNARDDNVPVWESDDLEHWTDLGDAAPELPSWARSAGMTWAPSVVDLAGRYVMYLTVADRRSGRQCILTATSPEVAGPYVFLRTHPLQCSARGSIDASPFVDQSDRVWLVWKDEPSGSAPARIVAAQLDFSGLEITGGETTLIVGSSAAGDANVEGPSLVRTAHGYRLFFSSGDWKTSSYRTGYADCTSLEKACEVIDTAWLSSANGLQGPGGLEVFRAIDGSTYAAFHTWSGCRACGDGYRALNIRRLNDSRTPRLR
jgi:beta-xylosidase